MGWGWWDPLPISQGWIFASTSEEPPWGLGTRGPPCAGRGSRLRGYPRLSGPKPIVSSGRSLPLCPSRRRSEIPKGSSAKKQPVTSRPKGKSMLKGQTSKQSQVQALPQSHGEEGIVDQILAEMAVRKTVKAKPSHPRGALTFETPVIAVLSATSSEASLL